MSRFLATAVNLLKIKSLPTDPEVNSDCSNYKTVDLSSKKSDKWWSRNKRKEKDLKFLPVSNLNEESVQPAFLTQTLTSRQLKNVNFIDIIVSPNIDEKEWILSNLVAFVGLMDSVYECFDSYCTDSLCSKLELPVPM